MKISIEQVNNGYIIEQEGKKFCALTELELLQQINYLTDSTSRHDASRIYIIDAPGDKHKDFTEELADIIWPEEI